MLVKFSRLANPDSWTLETTITGEVKVLKFDATHLERFLETVAPHMRETATLFPIGLAIRLRHRVLYPVGYSDNNEVACIDVCPDLLNSEELAQYMHTARAYDVKWLLENLEKH